MDRGTRRCVMGLLLAVLFACVLPAETALARPAMGGACKPQDFRPSRAWMSSVRPDARAEYLLPVNFVRIYSGQHSAERIAPRKWVSTQLELANRLYRLSDRDMARHGEGNPAPCMQFRLNNIHDVHENEVSEILGYKLDTENVYGNTKHNGGRRSGTWDLRSLKVTDGTQYLTVYCVWAIKDKLDTASSIGGESNVGFADRPPRGPRRVLTRVTSTRARMGVVLACAEKAWMNTVAHEFGHYFGLYHAWERARNTRCGIGDLGSGPKGSVDTHSLWANVMDYDNGNNVAQYFARSQLKYMYDFAKRKASTQIMLHRKSGGGGTPPPAKKPAARFRRAWTDPPSAGGKVVVHAHMETEHLLGKSGNIVAWFYDKTGQMLRDADSRYRSTNGHISVGGTFSPRYEKSTYKDYRLTLPAGQLHLPPGRHEVSVMVGAFYAGKLLGTSKRVSFVYVVPGAPETVHTGGPAAAWFTAASVDPTVTYKGATWVRIRADLRLDNLLGQDVKVQARFYFSKGKALRDFDNRYRSSDGLAFAESKIVPKYVRTNATKMDVWIPVSQLHLAAGSHKMYAHLTISHKGRALATKLTDYFTVGKQTTAPPPLTKSANLHAVWVTHNHVFNKVKGMLVHARFTVSGCRGQKVMVASWYWFGNGKPLKDFDGKYNASGQVAASVTVTPIYDVATFSDCTIFIPYSQLHLRAGTHSLGVNMGVFLGKTRIGYRAPLTKFRVTWRD